MFVAGVSCLSQFNLGVEVFGAVTKLFGQRLLHLTMLKNNRWIYIWSHLCTFERLKAFDWFNNVENGSPIDSSFRPRIKVNLRLRSPNILLLLHTLINTFRPKILKRTIICSNRPASRRNRWRSKFLALKQILVLFTVTFGVLHWWAYWLRFSEVSAGVIVEN